MNWEQLKEQIEKILDIPIRLERYSVMGQHHYADSSLLLTESQVIELDDEVHFLLDRNEDFIEVLVADATLITRSERQLIQLMLEVYLTLGHTKKDPDHSPAHMPSGSKEEKAAMQLRDWIQSQLEQGNHFVKLPSSFESQSYLYKDMVPLLLHNEYVDNRRSTYEELKKLLDSFFDAKTILIPLQDKEWLVLCSETLLSDEDKGIGDEESVEDSIAQLCLGLYGMMGSEGFGECHISAHYPIIPAESLLATVVELRHIMALGRTYHVGSTIHLPWELQLERIVNLLPDTEKRKIISTIFKREDFIIDSETLQTLEQFFALDCNVSETAKTLYIHRNTLTYRLDRFKQDTGLDVRSFNDGILAKICLLLYKVTKTM